MNIMKTVAEYYQRNLLGEDTRGIEYLESQGIKNQDTIHAFEVGYANGGLTKSMSSDHFEILKQEKLVDQNGRNRFQSGITIPLYNLEGEICDIVGQNLGKVGEIKVLAFEAKGFGHFPALGQKKLIVTDYPILALKCYQEGYCHVVLCPNPKLLSQLSPEELICMSYREADKMAQSAPESSVKVGYCHFNGRHNRVKEALDKVKWIREAPITPVTSVTEELPEGTNLLDKVVSDLDELGYVGESVNKKLAYLIASSRKLSKPLSAIIVSSSGAGKTGLMNAVGQLIPEEDKLFLSRLTPQALYYMPPDSLVEKLIVVDERNGSSMADYSIRTMQTSNVLTLARPGKGKDGQDKGIKSVNVRSAYMESTTAEDINPENASRCLLLNLHETPESTEEILRAQRRIRHTSISQQEGLLKWHHDFQRELKALPVHIPYMEHLTFPAERIIYRREQGKFLGLIEASALIHQHDREIKNGYIMANPEDYKTAHDLYMVVFDGLHQELSRNAKALLVMLENKQKTTFTVREGISQMGWSYSMVYRTIKELLNYEYLRQDHDGNGKQKTFTVLDYSCYGAGYSKLLSPDKLFKLFNNYS